MITVKNVTSVTGQSSSSGSVQFGGVIGDTLAESTPWFAPSPPATGGPNIIMFVLDDTGFGHLGCYGSTLRTPNIDRLAESGLRYTNFHTTSLCSPTRACLMTGHNHHSVGMRGISNWNTGFPHMTGRIPKDIPTVAERLRDHGYATLAAGKWHLAPMEDSSAAGPHDQWPLQRGFDRYYGFLQGETDQFSPELTRDNHHIDPPDSAADGYHVSEDIVSESVGWIRDLRSLRAERPFFLYLAFGAMHAPHHAPKEYLDRWRGAFDEGYDVIRERWFENQKSLGLIPPNTNLCPPNPGVPAWDELSSGEQRFAARLQEAFAAMLEHTDDQIGSLMSELETLDRLDNTVVILLSDNGASQEGGARGVLNEWSFFNGVDEQIDSLTPDQLDEIGGPNSYPNIPWGWAQAGNVPLRWYKQNTYGGGLRTPLIVNSPQHVDPESEGSVRSQFCHAIDVAATVLDIAGCLDKQHDPLDLLDPQDSRGFRWSNDSHEPHESHSPVVSEHSHDADRRVTQLTGRSILDTLNNPDTGPVRPTQYFEQLGHRGIFHNGWKATTYHDQGTPFDEDKWELFDLTTDFSETVDLSQQYPEKLQAMIDLWWSEARRFGVLPLDDRTLELFLMDPRPHSPHASGVYRFLPPVSHLPADACPRFGTQSYVATARIDISEMSAPGEPSSDGIARPDGIIFSRGSATLGQCFWISGDTVLFSYHAFGKRTLLRAPITWQPGLNQIDIEFIRADEIVATQESHRPDRTDSTNRTDVNSHTATIGSSEVAGPVDGAGVFRLRLNGDVVDQAVLPRLVLIFGAVGMKIGRGPVNAIVPELSGPAPFSGNLKELTFRRLAVVHEQDERLYGAVELSRE